MGFDLNEFFQSKVQSARGGYQSAQKELQGQLGEYDQGGPMDTNPQQEF